MCVLQVDDLKPSLAVLVFSTSPSNSVGGERGDSGMKLVFRKAGDETGPVRGSPITSVVNHELQIGMDANESAWCGES